MGGKPVTDEFGPGGAGESAPAQATLTAAAEAALDAVWVRRHRALLRTESIDEHRGRAALKALAAEAQSAGRLGFAVGVWADLLKAHLGARRRQARETWARIDAVRGELRPAFEVALLPLLESALAHFEAGKPLLDGDELVAEAQRRYAEAPETLDGWLLVSVQLADTWGESKLAARLRGWLFFFEARRAPASDAADCWKQARDRAGTAGDPELSKLVAAESPSRPKPKRRKAATCSNAATEPIVEVPVGWFHGIGKVSAALHPADPRARVDLPALDDWLSATGFRGAWDGEFWAQGPRFLESIDWDGPNPQPWLVAQIATVRIAPPQQSEHPSVMSTRASDPPRCPGCRKKVARARQLREAFEQTAGQAPFVCSACGWSGTLGGLDWAHWMGAATCWLTLVEMDSALGCPSAALLSELEAETGVPWSWTWLS